MNYFFVFQNKSYDEEYRGGYLWAPQYGNNGRRVSHWDKMKSVKRGDLIIHSYKKEIKAVSIAKADVYAAKRPSELSNEWQEEGWRVDCQYMPFDNSILTSDYMDTLLELQPKIDAPFNRIGRGNTGYLFEANKKMFEFIISKIAEAQKNEQEKQRIYGLLDYKIENNLTGIEIDMCIEETQAKQLTMEKLAEVIKGNSAPKNSQKKESTVYYRSPYIKEMVKQIANGKCQMCGDDAPFKDKSNEPYLESHHVKRLADGGSDTVDNVVAICPNCHRKMHVLNDAKDVVFLEGIAHNNDAVMKRMMFYQSNMGKTKK